jgi:hypothetical protein
MADVDGDGRDDVCARAPDGFFCWIAGDHAFDRMVAGPEWDDASGFTSEGRYRSIRLADVDGDGRADACAREDDALRCYLSEGFGFGRVWIAPAWSDATGLGSGSGLVSIRIAGGGTPGPRIGAASVMSCSAGVGRHGAGGVVLALLGLALVVRRRR